MSDEKNSAPVVRDAIRGALLGTPAPFKHVEREINGQKVELREPTVSQRAAILRAAGITEVPRKGQPPPRMDIAKLHVEALLACVYVPGTNDRVFGNADREALMSQPAGGFVDELGEECLALMGINDNDSGEEDADPNS